MTAGGIFLINHFEWGKWLIMRYHYQISRHSLNLCYSNVYLSLLYRLNSMLDEYKNMISPLPPAVAPMLKPFTDRVDEAVKPGVVSLTWSSIKINECMYWIIVKFADMSFIGLMRNPLIHNGATKIWGLDSIPVSFDNFVQNVSYYGRSAVWRCIRWNNKCVSVVSM